MRELLVGSGGPPDRSGPAGGDDTREALTILVVLPRPVARVPVVGAWSTGRLLVERRDDRPLPERIIARASRLVQVMAASVAVLFLISPHEPWIFVLP